MPADASSAKKKPALKGAPPGGLPALIRQAQVVVRIAALVVGFSVSMLGFASLLGLATESGWRYLGGAAIALVVPAAVLYRLHPKDGGKLKPGVIPDIAGILLMIFAVLFATPVASRWLVAEGDRLARSGAWGFAVVTYWLGGAMPVDKLPAAPVASGSAAASASGAPSASASAPAGGR
jgi:hypothetical protein